MAIWTVSMGTGDKKGPGSWLEVAQKPNREQNLIAVGDFVHRWKRWHI